MEPYLAGKQDLNSASTDDSKASVSSNGSLEAVTASTNIQSENRRVVSEDPKIEVVVESDIIRKIIVNCSCGKCTELECRY